MKHTPVKHTFYLLFICLYALSALSLRAVTCPECAPLLPTTCTLPPEESFNPECSGPRSFFLPRSQGAELARQYAGWQEILPKCTGRAFGYFSAAVEYKHSFKSDHIAQYLFGSTCLHFTGSQVADRNSHTDLLADNFGLLPTFVGTVCFKPVIENIVVDLNLYVGLDAWAYGLYFQLNAPVTWTRWNLGLGCNEINNSNPDDQPPFAALYMSEAPAKPVTLIRKALSGTGLFGDMQTPWHFGRFACGALDKTGLAQFDVLVGYNFFLTDRYHLGIYAKIVAPTGNKSASHYIFEPIVGNGDRWQAGAGMDGDILLFNHGLHSMRLYGNGYLTHRFTKFQIRSFDICGLGPLSRYLLLKELDSNNNYTGNMINAINFTTRAARIGQGKIGEFLAKLSYYYSKFSFDVGYNLYAMDAEHVHLDSDLYPSDLNTRIFAIKGIAGDYFSVVDGSTGIPTGMVLPLNATESTSIITQAGPQDNPAPITTLKPGQIALDYLGNEAFSSNPPVIVSRHKLDLRSGGAPSQLIHTVFGHLAYTNLEHCWEPQIGLGGSADFDGKSAYRSGLNQWSVWVKAAAAF